MADEKRWMRELVAPFLCRGIISVLTCCMFFGLWSCWEKRVEKTHPSDALGRFPPVSKEGAALFTTWSVGGSVTVTNSSLKLDLLAVLPPRCE